MMSPSYMSAPGSFYNNSDFPQTRLSSDMFLPSLYFLFLELNARKEEASAEDVRTSFLDDYSPGSGNQGNTRDLELRSQK